MEKNKTILIVAVVVIIAIAAVSAYMVMSNGGSDKSTVSFLVEDDEGVYFWAEGSGSNALDAFTNAMDKLGYEYEVGNMGADSKIVNSINGLANPAGYAKYWQLYYYKDTGLALSDLAINNIKGSQTLALIFDESGDLPDNVPALSVKVVRTSSSDTMFYIQSTTGFWTAYNGKGTTMMEAFKNVMETYKIPYNPNAGGIDWIFDDDLNMKKSGDDWYYWQQYVLNSTKTEWILNDKGMSDTKTSDYDRMCIYYGKYGDAPSVPIKENEYVTVTDAVGNVITLAKGSPLCLVSSNQAEWAQILGLEKYIISMCDGAFENAVLNDELSKKTNVGPYKTAQAETIANSGCAYVINPKSMGLPTAVQAELESVYGIKCIALNGYGESMLSDAQLFVDITGAGQDKLNDYKKTYDEVVNYAKNAAKGATHTDTFLACLSTASDSGKGMNYYSISSEMGKNLLSIDGVDATVELAGDKGAKTFCVIQGETIFNYDQEGKLDYLFLRTSASVDGDLQANYDRYYNSNYAKYGKDLNVTKNGGAFVFETDIMSGCRDYIGILAFAKAFGFDTGSYDLVKLANDFNTKYGFKNSYTEVLLNVPSS